MLVVKFAKKDPNFITRNRDKFPHLATLTLLVNFAKKIQKSPIQITLCNRDKFTHLATLMMLVNFAIKSKITQFDNSLQ